MSDPRKRPLPRAFYRRHPTSVAGDSDNSCSSSSSAGSISCAKASGTPNSEQDNRRPLTAFPASMPRETGLILFVTQDMAPQLREAFEREEAFPNDFTYTSQTLGGTTLLHLAVTTRKTDVVRVLLEFGCNPDPVETNMGYTPLFFTGIARDEYLEERATIAQLLVDYGADPYIKDKMGASVIDRTMQVNGGDNQIVNILRRAALEQYEQQESEAAAAGAGANEHGNNNNNNDNKITSAINTSLDANSATVIDNRLASQQERQQGNESSPTVLIGGRPKIKKSDLLNATTVLSAVAQGKIDQLKAFDDFVDAEFLNKGYDGQSFAYYAAASGKTESLRWLIGHGCDINYRGPRGETCLHQAIIAGGKEMAKELVRQGVDLSLKAFDGQTSYSLAKRAYQMGDVLSLMLEQLTNNAINSPSQVPDYLLTLIKTQNVRLMKVLADCSVIDVDLLKTAHPNGNVFYLHFAAEQGKTDALRELLELKAPIDQQNLVGNTALHIAIKCKNAACAQALIDANANMEIRNGMGETVTDCAVRGRDNEIIRAVEAGWKKFVRSGRSSVFDSSRGGTHNNISTSSSSNNNMVGGSNVARLASSSSSDSDQNRAIGMMGAPQMTGMLVQSGLSVALDDLTLAYLSRFPRNFIFDPTDIELQQHLATGGGGAVHLATIHSQDRLVAAKIFREADSIHKAVDECERAVRLHHKNIVQHVGLTVAKSAFSTDLVLLMELGEGSLQDALRSEQGPTQFDFDTVYSYMKQVAEGLMYLHSKNNLWLDGKPGNLLFFNNRKVLKLCDFGLTREIARDKTHDTVSRAGAGTLRYMSKQQLNEEQVRPSDDIYSYGATFFALVCGVEPWQGASMPQIMAGNLIDQFQPRHGCPEVLSAVVKACLAVDPKDRPQNGKELLRLLLPVEEEMPNSVSMPTTTSDSVSGSQQQQQHEVSDDVTEQIDADVTW